MTSTAGTELRQATIVIGVDFTEWGDVALREALLVAKRAPGSELHVVHVIPTHGDWHEKRNLADLSDELRSGLDRLRAHVLNVCAPAQGAATFKQQVVFHVRLGDPASALIQLAVDTDADMIVVGTHGRQGLDKLAFGSVAETLIRTAPMPVLVAHPKNLSGFQKTPAMQRTQPGDDFHSHGLTHRAHLEFIPRTTHISGLI